MVVWWSKFGFLARIIVFKGASEHGRLTHEFLTILRIPVSSPRIVHHHFWGVSCWLVVTGTWLLSFLSVGNFMIPIDEHIFFRGVGLNHQPVIYHPHFYPLLCTITIYYHLLLSIIIYYYLFIIYYNHLLSSVIHLFHSFNSGTARSTFLPAGGLAD